MRYITLMLLSLLLLSMAAANAATPTVTSGAYTFTIDSTARVLDLTQQENNASILVTLGIKGNQEILGKVIELVQQPEFLDENGRKFILREIRLPNKTSLVNERSKECKLSIQIWLADNAEATTLANFSATLMAYDKKDSFRLDFLSVAEEDFTPQQLNGMTIMPEILGVNSKKQYQVKMTVHMPTEESDPSIQWMNEQLELIDSDGAPQTALSTSRTYQYDDAGKVKSKTITATFPAPNKAPRGLRYRIECLKGVKILPYHFENIPLP